MIPVSKAFEILDREVSPLGTERVDLCDALGRILAEEIVADSDLPPFDRSQMDGYAIRAKDTRKLPANLKVVGESAAGRGWHREIRRGEAVRIMTGAPVPPGADAVQKIELAKELKGLVSLIDPVTKGLNIVPKGSEIKQGEVVLRPGSCITAEMIATPAAFGYAKVRVAKRPSIAIVPTGSEIVPVGKKPKVDQIRDSNSVMLKALCLRAGIEATVYSSVGDDLVSLTNTIVSAAGNADIVVTTGGVSVGKYDLTKAAFVKMGAKLHFERIALKPGKPAVFAKSRKKLFFGLPGNPVSAAVTFYLFVLRAIMLMQSASNVSLERGFAIVKSPLHGNRYRDIYVPGGLATSADGRVMAVPVEWGGSSDLVAFAKARALIVVPKATSYAAGDVAEVLFL